MLNMKKKPLLEKYSQEELRHLEDLMGGQEIFISHYNLTPSEYFRAVGNREERQFKSVQIDDSIKVRYLPPEVKSYSVPEHRVLPAQRVISNPTVVYTEVRNSSPVRIVTQAPQIISSPSRRVSTYTEGAKYASPSRIVNNVVEVRANPSPGRVIYPKQ